MHKLLIIRHAIAFERDAQRWPDDAERPLTRRGRHRFRAVARGVANVLNAPEQLLSSPLKRARQTARILEEEAEYPEAIQIDELSPTAPTGSLVSVLAACTATYIAIVGHEPSLSSLISALLASPEASLRSRLKKGGIAVLAFDDEIAMGQGELLMFAPPRLLGR